MFSLRPIDLFFSFSKPRTDVSQENFDKTKATLALGLFFEERSSTSVRIRATRRGREFKGAPALTDARLVGSLTVIDHLIDTLIKLHEPERAFSS